MLFFCLLLVKNFISYTNDMPLTQLLKTLLGNAIVMDRPILKWCKSTVVPEGRAIDPPDGAGFRFCSPDRFGDFFAAESHFFGVFCCFYLPLGSTFMISIDIMYSFWSYFPRLKSLPWLHAWMVLSPPDNMFSFVMFELPTRKSNSKTTCESKAGTGCSHPMTRSISRTVGVFA